MNLRKTHKGNLHFSTIPGFYTVQVSLIGYESAIQKVSLTASDTQTVGGYDYVRLFPDAPRNRLATVAYTF